MALVLASIRQTPSGYAVRPASSRTVFNAVLCNVCGEALAEVWKVRSSGEFMWCGRGARLDGVELTREKALDAALKRVASSHKCAGGEGLPS